MKDTDNAVGTGGGGGGGGDEEDEEEEMRRKGWKMRGRRWGKEEDEPLCLMFHWISGEYNMTGHFTDWCVIYKPQHLHTNIQDTPGHSKHKARTHTF